MSIRALLKGVEKRLRSAAVFNDQPAEPFGRLVGVMPAPGAPPRNFGQFWVSVSYGGGRGVDRNPQKLHVEEGVLVTLTARLNYAPRDRQGSRLTTVGDVYDLFDRITGIDCVHGDWRTIRYANEFIEGSEAWAALADGRTATVNGFCGTLVLGAKSAERPAPAGWVGEGDAKDVYVMDARFDLAERRQVYYGADDGVD